MRASSLGVWPPLSPAALIGRRASRLPFPLAVEGALITPQGRQGLHLGLRALGIGRGDEVLIPAYHHGSEVQAVRETGAECVYYEGDENLEPIPEELDSLVSAQTRALHVTHFVGIPQDAVRWRSWCDERGLLLVEDAAQAWLGEVAGDPLGSHADLAVFCLYKSVGVPDGAATVIRGGQLAPSRGGRVPGLGPAARLLALWAAQRLPAPQRSGGDAAFNPTTEFALGDTNLRVSPATDRLLPRFDYDRVGRRRRENYATLLQALAERVQAPFDALPAGAVPWFFPIRAADKPGALEHLAAAGIRALDFWSIGHPSLRPKDFPGIAARRRETIGLPVHQELSRGDIARIAESASAAPR